MKNDHRALVCQLTAIGDYVQNSFHALSRAELQQVINALEDTYHRAVNARDRIEPSNSLEPGVFG